MHFCFHHTTHNIYTQTPPMSCLSVSIGINPSYTKPGVSISLHHMPKLLANTHRIITIHIESFQPTPSYHHPIVNHNHLIIKAIPPARHWANLPTNTAVFPHTPKPTPSLQDRNILRVRRLQMLDRWVLDLLLPEAKRRQQRLCATMSLRRRSWAGLCRCGCGGKQSWGDMEWCVWEYVPGGGVGCIW